MPGSNTQRLFEQDDDADRQNTSYEGFQSWKQCPSGKDCTKDGLNTDNEFTAGICILL